MHSCARWQKYIMINFMEITLLHLPMKTKIWWWEYRNNIDTAKVYNKVEDKHQRNNISNKKITTQYRQWGISIETVFLFLFIITINDK